MRRSERSFIEVRKAVERQRFCTSQIYSRNSIIRPSVIRISDYPDCQPRPIYFNMNLSERALRPARAPLGRRSTRVVLLYESANKIDCQILRVFNRTRQSFEPNHHLLLQEAQVRPQPDHCCRLWARAPRYRLLPLDSIRRRASRIVDEDLSSTVFPKKYHKGIFKKREYSNLKGR
ncbi:hypothetical protein EVAR_34131_1 [Eumeta japonica]|uniref:Uncharacterized protein n=1 Tax=Eumeta variegata TaxID=151549 RepID=A0A4C1WMI2_EUMVA|nr:hypothetical protein EVAR_34131_1 [Eumeta japonica]